MTTTVKIALGVVLVAIVGFGGWYGFKNNSQSESAGKEEALANEPAGKKMAFNKLVEQGGTYTCTVNQTVGQVTSNGTVYMDRGLLRGEFAVDYAGQKVTAYFIMRDGFTYTWNSMMPTQGMKINNTTAVQAGDTKAGADGSITANTPNGYLEQIGDYHCEAWTADASKFAIPTSITFRAIN